MEFAKDKEKIIAYLKYDIEVEKEKVIEERGGVGKDELKKQVREMESELDE